MAISSEINGGADVDLSLFGLPLGRDVVWSFPLHVLREWSAREVLSRRSTPWSGLRRREGRRYIKGSQNERAYGVARNEFAHWIWKFVFLTTPYGLESYSSRRVAYRIRRKKEERKKTSERDGGEIYRGDFATKLSDELSSRKLMITRPFQ